MEEITARSADFFTGVNYAARLIYTRTDIELIIQHMCKSDY